MLAQSEGLDRMDTSLSLPEDRKIPVLEVSFY
jgi:hypothetical protein